ncbi:hypothetical protein F444_19550 [Phytophthora nicotianae P1976]|uniref:PiggyBac transposable element-derived protein domain-containing protein n=1 Tax=Phytophthora nicotianae P1976 TaxID=1317066 RepID=A0A080Z7B1_PHYNI|nr:hypothetical protein F444_19550 [Phytophthora nicotianae P1976]
MPGKTRKDTRCVDFFVGEEELTRYLDRLDIETAAKAKQAVMRLPEASGPDQNLHKSSASSADGPEDVVTQHEKTTSQDEQNTGDRTEDADIDCVHSPCRPPSTSKCDPAPRESVPMEDVRESGEMVGDRESNAMVGERNSKKKLVQHDSGEVDGSCELDSAENPTRNLDEQFRSVGDDSNAAEHSHSSTNAAISSDINLVQDPDDDGEYKAMESDCDNDDGASCGDESESEGETDDITEKVHVEDEEEADDTLFNASLIDSDMSISGWAKPVSYSPFPYLHQPYESRTLASVRDKFEVYCGKRQSSGTAEQKDTKSGPAAVIQILIEVFGTSGTAEKRLIVTDRFYTSPALAMELLALGFYSIGTVMTNRRGLCTESIVKKKKKTRPASVDRGTYTVAQSTLVPSIHAVYWWANRPVHLLCAGGSVEQDRVVCCEKSGEAVEVACPKILKDYQTFMGGVDVHDQLRLQRYSLQLALKYKKYYRSLFLGVSRPYYCKRIYSYNRRRAMERKNKMKHVKFLKQQHMELVQLQESDWDALRSKDGTPVKAGKPTRLRAYEHVQVAKWREGNNGQERMRRQRACKVCSVLKGSDEARGGGGLPSIVVPASSPLDPSSQRQHAGTCATKSSTQ